MPVNQRPQLGNACILLVLRQKAQSLVQLRRRSLRVAAEALQHRVVRLDGVVVVLLPVGNLAQVELRRARRVVHRVVVHHVAKLAARKVVLRRVEVPHRGLHRRLHRRSLRAGRLPGARCACCRHRTRRCARYGCLRRRLNVLQLALYVLDGLVELRHPRLQLVNRVVQALDLSAHRIQLAARVLALRVQLLLHRVHGLSHLVGLVGGLLHQVLQHAKARVHGRLQALHHVHQLLHLRLQRDDLLRRCVGAHRCKGQQGRQYSGGRNPVPNSSTSSIHLSPVCG